MEKSKSTSLRKGPWTYEEDKLLIAYINKYGEGKWHLVPKIAGLNRCRKSCRLRWMNYLNPTINRESFEEDEIDMILRLHKLLGNRWSLIAGRLPGRTSNDVKNYWNTYLRKKVVTENEETEKSRETPKAHEVIKPRPLSLLTNSQCGKHNFVSNGSASKLAIATSSEDGNVPRMCDDTTPTNIDDKQPCVGNELFFASYGEIGSCSFLQEDNSIDFSKVEDFLSNSPTINDSYLNSNFIWDL